MSRRLPVCLALAAGLAALVAPLPAADPAPEPLVDQVRTAIDRGVQFLKNEERGRGNWESSLSQAGIAASRPGGATALALLALLNCGVKPDDPVIRRGLDWLRAVEPVHTYVVGLQTMVFAEVGDPKDLPRIQRNVDWLIQARVFRGGVLHGWGYTADVSGTDYSNSQYALLGLYAGKQAGAKIDLSVWDSIWKFYRDTQQPDGGWVYSFDYGNNGSTLTMTVAGLCGVSIAAEELDAGQRRLNADGSDPLCGRYVENDAIRRALEWLGEGDVFGNGRFRFSDRGHTFYNVYGIERAGRLTGRRLLAGHDWYRDGCEFLCLPTSDARQHDDGSWYLSGGADGAVSISTSFALLFLSKGRTPILISKFAHGPDDDWNNKHHDARHLVEFASKELFKRQPLAWQVYDARRVEISRRDKFREEVGNLLQSPIVYMNGHRAPRLTPIQKQLLRAYLDEGGFLFAEACCGRKEFADGFRALMKELFPETDLAPLRPDHPIWTAHFAVRPDFVPLEGIEQGCKTVVVFSPQPLAGYWEVNRWTPRGNLPPVNDRGLNDRGTQAFRLAGNVIAYATGLEMPKPRLTKVEVADDSEDRHVPRGFLKAAQLKHEGDWQPAPRAMPNLMRYLRGEHKLDVTLQKEDLPIGSPDIFLYKFLYMHGRKAFDVPAEQLENLRADLKTGGLLLADACCGKAEFDRAFRTFAAKLFPDAKLEPIPPDDPFYGADINGTAITTVRLRKERPGTQEAEAEFRDSRPTYLEGIKQNGRWVVVYSRYDIGCALEKHASSDCKGYDHGSAVKLAAAAVLYTLKK
ncbi:MAG TPA: DUF4159 domain-containing protein [Gemmataceae bacterium]|jgi:hypothetical protein